MSGYPEIWLRDSITEATGVQAYPVMAPETAATPYVVYSRGGTEREQATHPLAGAPLAAFELFIVTDSYMGGKEIAEQIRLACNNFAGEYAGCKITSVILLNQQDGSPEEKDGETTPNYVQELSFAVRYKE